MMNLHHHRPCHAKSPALAPQKTFRQGPHSCYTISYGQTSFEKCTHPSIIFSLFFLFRGLILLLTSM